MKSLHLRKLTRIHWLLLGLAVLSAAFLLTTHPRYHVAAWGAALPPQTRTGPITIGPSNQITVKQVRKPRCSPTKIKKVLALAKRGPEPKEGDDFEFIDCSLTLTREDVLKGPITKRLIFEGANASDVTVDCNGATIDGSPGMPNYDPNRDTAQYMVEFFSKQLEYSPTGGIWQPPVNVTVRNCKIKGAVSIQGMVGRRLLDSSRLNGHSERARNNAPRNIVFDHVIIEGQGNRIPLYLYSGVSYFQMLDSEIKGKTYSVNIYLDSESYRNTFRNNYIHASGGDRELMALDGSSYNTIINNRFSAINQGGIYLYRNCGEAFDGEKGHGVIRHSTPVGNQIINNVFYYDRSCPSIMVGSRQGNGDKDSCSIGDRGYCDYDKGYPFGSSASDYDYARFNAVMQNQVYRGVHSVSDMFKAGRPPDINTLNYIEYNETVDRAIRRKAGCYISDGYPYFILDRDFVNLFHSAPNGEPVCRGYRLTCNDGVLTRSSDSTCQVSQVGHVDFDCQATANNKGCEKTVSVPPGKKIVGAKAACNLEFGMVSETDLNGVRPNSVKVLRASDDVSKGSCTLGSTSIRSGEAAIRGIIGLTSLPVGLDSLGLNRVLFGCREQDDNGGDCHIKGRLYYR
jgi:parallel beta-helix repeat protein